MTRYLTPSKIGILTLISLYTENVVPTTASIPILSFIIGHVLTPQPTESKSQEARCSEIPLPIEGFRTVTSAHQSVKPGRTIWDLLLDKLWEIDSFDALHFFFDHLSDLLVKTRDQQLEDEENEIPQPPTGRTRLSRTAPFGVFVRRAQLEFVRIQFHDSMALWHAFIRFRQPTLDMWAKRHPDANIYSFDVNINSLDADYKEPLANVTYGTNGQAQIIGEKGSLTSTDDLEKLLEFQVEGLQKFGGRVPLAITSKLRDLLRNSLAPPSMSHYLKFLDAWRSGDYPSSFDHLHRYFDYTMHSRDRTFYQYALLNLAILQAEFGCYGEAITAMRETISTARENKDMNCLNFSLSWLYHFSKTHPEDVAAAGGEVTMGNEREALSFLRSKAKESGMHSLWSTSLLGEAKLGLANGESVASAFENIFRSSHLNVSRGIDNLNGPQLLLLSSVWGRLGISCLASTTCEIFQEVYFDQAPLDDQLKLTCRYAYLLAFRGQAEQALVVMESVDPESLRALKAYQYWTVFSMLLKLKRDLRKGKFDAAEHLLAQLWTQPLSDREIRFEVQLMKIDLLARRQAFSAAMESVDGLAKSLEADDADIYQRIKLLIVKANLFKQCGQAEKGFSIAVRAASFAWRSRLLPALWEAVCALAEILLMLSEFEAAAEVTRAMMPQILETEDGFITGTAYAILVDAHVGMAGEAQSTSSSRKEHLAKALELLDQAFIEFSKCEEFKRSREMIAKKAMLLRLVGEPILATDYASKYLALKAQQETA